jgi:hypothetical protein
MPTAPYPIPAPPPWDRRFAAMVTDATPDVREIVLRSWLSGEFAEAILDDRLLARFAQALEGGLAAGEPSAGVLRTVIAGFVYHLISPAECARSLGFNRQGERDGNDDR